jgi:LemA protein
LKKISFFDIIFIGCGDFMNSITLTLILGIVILLAALILVFTIIYNRFQNAIIAINEAEASVDSELRKRFDILNKAVKVVKGYIGHEKEVLENIVKLRSRKLSNFDLDKELNKSITEFSALHENYAELNSNENFLKLQENVYDIEEQVSATRKFYNNKVSNYNKLVRKFPSNIIAKLWKYKEKDYFEFEEKEVELKELS